MHGIEPQIRRRPCAEHAETDAVAQKRIQINKNENGIDDDDWGETSGLRRRRMFENKNAFLISIGILRFENRHRSRRWSLCVFIILDRM